MSNGSCACTADMTCHNGKILKWQIIFWMKFYILKWNPFNCHRKIKEAISEEKNKVKILISYKTEGEY